MGKKRGETGGACEGRHILKPRPVPPPVTVRKRGSSAKYYVGYRGHDGENIRRDERLERKEGGLETNRQRPSASDQTARRRIGGEKSPWW